MNTLVRFRGNDVECASRHLLAALFLAVATAISAGAGTNSVAQFHVGFSSSVVVGINENDGKAALKVWSQTIAAEHGLEASPDPEMLDGNAAIERAIRGKAVDAVTITTEEYSRLGAGLMATNVILGANAGIATEQYVVLVAHESRFHQIADLRGRTVVFFENARASLAAVWFETLLLQAGLGETRQFCGSVLQETKLSQAVLPVFFHQADACVVTRRGFQTMIELNPQVGQQLRTIATSPPLVPVVFLFRADYCDPLREQILRKIRYVDATAAGQQVLTLFQCEKIEVQPVSVLASALDLLAAHGRLLSPPLASPAAAHSVQNQSLGEASTPGSVGAPKSPTRSDSQP